MLTTLGSFERKVNDVNYSDCVVEKVVKLSGREFDSFSNNLLRGHDFIRENAELMRFTGGKTHCILVTGENRQHGILVNSEGSDYARYSALLPNVETFLTANRYPALAELNKKLAAMVDHIAEIAVEARDGESDRSVIDVCALESKFGIEFEVNHELFSAVVDMIGAYEGIDGIEIDKNDIIIYWEPNHFLYADRAADHSTQPLSPLEEVLQAANIEHPSLSEVYALTKILIDSEDFRIERARAILSSGLAAVADVPGLIDFMDEDNLYRFDIIAVNTIEELGHYWLTELPDAVPEDVSAEEYGRQCIEAEKGVFTKWGYVYERDSDTSPVPTKPLFIPAYGHVAVDAAAEKIEPGGIHESKSKGAKENSGFTSVLKAIEDSKSAPKPTHDTKLPEKENVKQKNKGGDAL